MPGIGTSASLKSFSVCCHPSVAVLVFAALLPDGRRESLIRRYNAPCPLTRFVSAQPRYNLLFREVERELFPESVSLSCEPRPYIHSSPSRA